jgi:protocatechuate 3,4-dioxygenase beta subunit
MATLALLLSALFELAAPSPRLAGTVVDGKGAPVPGAEVRLLGWSGKVQDLREQARTRASTDGTFLFSGLPAGTYDLLAMAPGFAPERLSVPVSESAVLVRLVLRPGRTVTGLVVDGLGVPVAGARIELTRVRTTSMLPLDGEQGFYHAATGADGRFELPGVPAGQFKMEVRAEGFAPLNSPGPHLPAGEEGRADLGTLTLERGAALTGQVSDSAGKPVPDAEVWLVPYEIRNSDLDWSDYYRKGPAARTDADGAFEIPDLDPEEPVGLDVCRPGYLPISLYFQQTPGHPVEAVLEPAARLSGRVLDHEGSPVNGAQVRAWISGEYPDDASSARPCFHETGSARTGADGRFVLDALSPGWWTVRASAQGWPSADSERRMIRSGESAEELEIVLRRPPGIVAGRVLLPGGAPAAGAHVSLLGEDTLTTIADGNGAYRLEGVEPGPQEVYAEAETGRPVAAGLEVVPGENRLDLTLEPDGLHEVRGRVAGPDGEPVAGAEVIPGGAEAAPTATSEADGSFVLRLKDGEYRLTADREGYGPVDGHATVDGGPVAGVVLSLPRAGSIRGRLLGLSREALASAWVEVRVLTASTTRSSRVDLQGTYLLDGVPPGAWKVSAYAETRTAEGQVELKAGEDEALLDLAFNSAWEVSGRITGPEGEPVAGAWLQARGQEYMSMGTNTLLDGSFRLELEDGTYSLEVRMWDLFLARGIPRVRVAGAPVVGIEIPMKRGATLRGQILGLEPGELAWQIRADGPTGRVSFGYVGQESRYAIPRLFPGTWMVTARYGDREAVGSVTFVEGQEEAVLDLAFGEK